MLPWFPLCRGRRSKITTKKAVTVSTMGLKMRTIAIDAGHGGHDPGAIGKSGLKEKNVTLDIAKRLAVLVKDRLGCEVVMTRDRDVFIPLDQKTVHCQSQVMPTFLSLFMSMPTENGKRGESRPTFRVLRPPIAKQWQQRRGKTPCRLND